MSNNASHSLKNLYDLFVVVSFTTFIAGGSAIGEEKQHGPLPGPVHLKPSSEMRVEMPKIDHIKTGAAGDQLTQRIWKKMKEEQAACNNCALRQPFPEDDPAQN